MDRSRFYAALRSRASKAFGTSLSQSQVDGLEKILDEGVKRGVELRQLAYILATAYHETAHTMQPIRERGGEKYLRSKKYYPWVGEGLVQVTWEENHRKFGATKPGQLLEWPIALKALYDGMLKGMFTGRKLSDYISGEYVDYTGARRVVNGTDRAGLIAGYAKSFEDALADAGYYRKIGTQPAQDAPKPVPATHEPPKPQPAPAPTPAAQYEERNLFWRLLYALFRLIFRKVN